MSLWSATEDVVLASAALAVHLLALPFAVVAWLKALLDTVAGGRRLPEAVRRPRVVAITGASNGIGEALAYAYAAPGVTLVLIARRKDKLEAVAKRCQARGALTELGFVDVTDAAALSRFLTEQDTKHPIDLVVANAGVSSGMLGPDKNIEERAHGVFAVNVEGAFNTILPLLERFKDRRSGQIAVVSSLSAFIDRAHSPSYQASKVAINTYVRALRAAMSAYDVHVSTICPGFVETAFTAVTRSQKRSTPFLMSAEAAAAIIKRGLARNDGIIAFPTLMYIFVHAMSTLPGTIKGQLVATVSNVKSIPWKQLG